MSKTIPLPHGLFAIVDDDDFERCNQFRWSTASHGYVQRACLKSDGSRTIQLLHRFIMDAPDGVEVDHIIRNKLDNQKSNLRLATKSQNAWNRGKSKNNTSGFKGVTWNKRKSKWVAEIMARGKRIRLGYFNDIIAAAAAYAAAAKELHGEFART